MSSIIIIPQQVPKLQEKKTSLQMQENKEIWWETQMQSYPMHNIHQIDLWVFIIVI